MTAIIKEAMVGVAVCWAVAGYSIWKWGPGLRKRLVRCPERKVRATVLADQREAEFGTMRVVDIKACSLTPAQVNCSKQCRVCL
jgi:hypothetical protein